MGCFSLGVFSIMVSLYRRKRVVVRVPSPMYLSQDILIVSSLLGANVCSSCAYFFLCVSPQPCYERVKDWLNENLVALWIFALCTALTQVITAGKLCDFFFFFSQESLAPSSLSMALLQKKAPTLR